MNTKNAIAAASTAAVTAAYHWPVLGFHFVRYDDDIMLQTLAARPHGLAATLRWALTTTQAGTYQPVGWIVDAALDAAQHGAVPFGHHAVVLALHATAAALLCLVAARLLDLARPGGRHHAAAAAFGALLFAMHPLQAQAVAWASAKGDLLAACFLLGATLAYLRPERTGRALAVAWALAILSGLCRWKGACFLPLAMLLDVYPLRRLPASPLAWGEPEARRTILEKIPLLLIAALVVAANAIAKRQAYGYAMSPRPMDAATVLLFFAAKWIGPMNLLPVYSFAGAANPMGWAPAAATAGVAGLTAGFVVLRRTAPALLVAWAFAVASLLPVCLLAAPGQPVYTHDFHAYFAGLGVAVAAAAGLAIALERSRLALLAMAMPLLIGTAARREARPWHDTTALWEHAWGIDPSSRDFVARYGRALQEGGHFGDALMVYMAQEESDPAAARANAGAAWVKMARTHAAAGRLKEAADALRQAERAGQGDAAVQEAVRRERRALRAATK
ncbi:MAG: hypothetical protein V4510_09945 [bacterium]